MSEQEPNIGLVLIDDSFIDRTIVSKNMELFYPNRDMEYFISATDALEALKADTVMVGKDHCALLLDIHMPEMNGFSFVDAFGELPENIRNRFAIFMLSSSIDGGDMSKVEDRMLIKKFVSKPLNQEVLSNIFKWTLESYNASREH